MVRVKERVRVWVRVKFKGRVRVRVDSTWFILKLMKCNTQGLILPSKCNCCDAAVLIYL